MTGSGDTTDGERAIRVLHVDSDRDALAALASHVATERDDVTVTSVADGSEALVRLGDGRIDCLVLGDDVAGASRERLADAAEVPVVLYTDSPGRVGGTLLDAADALVEREDSDRGRRFLVEKAVSVVLERDRTETRTPESARAPIDRVKGRASYFLVYADGSVVWSSHPFEEVFPVEAAAVELPDTPDLYERLSALLADDPEAIPMIRGEPGEPTRFTIPHDGGQAHFRHVRYDLPESIGALDLVVFEDLTDAVRRLERLDAVEPLAERASNGLYLLDEYGFVDYCNESFATIVGTDPDDLVGEHAAALLADGEFRAVQRTVDRHLADRSEAGASSDDETGGEAPETANGGGGAEPGATIETTFVDADGDEIDVAVEWTVLADADGSFGGLTGVVRDDTEP